MSLSIDPYLVKEEKLKNEKKSRARWKTRNGLRIPKLGERVEGKGKWKMKPHPSKLDDIKENPYHMTKNRVSFTWVYFCLTKVLD